MATSVYRDDITGLRAIAVLLVLLYHSGIAFFQGGFIGVDVFFVISGFLITGLLNQELQTKGKIQFAEFYLRRCKRLLPALFFTLIASTIAACLLFSPNLLIHYAQSVIYSLLFISNIYFYQTGGYFDIDSALKPLLHTWSLGIEEQFYLFWPLIIYVSKFKKVSLSVMVSLLLGLSLFLTILCDRAYPNAEFYLLPFRIFEFAIGALLIFIPAKTVKYKEYCSFLGFVMVLGALFAYSQALPYPKLLACLGAALCIYAGSDTKCNRILSNKILLFIGLISYSLYLIHWPIMVFYKQYLFHYQLSLRESASLIALSMVIAALMYQYVEQPIRQSKTNHKLFLLGSAATGMVLVVISCSMLFQSGWIWRPMLQGNISNELVRAYQQGKDFRFHIYEHVCIEKTWKKCADLSSNKINALILGDSHSIDALNAFYELYPEHNYVLSSQPGCPPYDNPELFKAFNDKEKKSCISLNKSRYNINYLRKFDYIVINLLYAWYTPEHLKQYLEFLHQNGIKKVIVLGNFMSLKSDIIELIKQFGLNNEMLQKNSDYSLVTERKLKQYTQFYGYLFISKYQSFCKHKHCELIDKNGIPFTYDQHHLSYEFAQKMLISRREIIDRYI